MSADGLSCGRVKDIYFDDQNWQIRHLVAALEPRRFGKKQILLEPNQVQALDFETGAIQLGASSEAVAQFRPAVSVLPVCKQYASLAMASPGARTQGNGPLNGVDPHLRSTRTVITYRLDLAGEFAGMLADFIWNDETWEIRYLTVEQSFDRRKLQFHILPQSVERFTWSTQRVLLRALQPVELAAEEKMLSFVAA